MQLFTISDSKTFKLNNIRYTKNFIVLKVGDENIAIYNAYDTKLQLLSSTHFSQISVAGVVYSSQATLIEALAPFVFFKAGSDGSSSGETNGIYVEKSTFSPANIFGNAEHGSAGLGKNSALTITGTIPKLKNIIKNNSSDYYTGQLFILTDKTTLGNVELPHFDTSGGLGSIAFFHPEGKSYFTTKDEAVIFVLDFISGQKVYRRISSSLQEGSVTRDKMAKINGRTVLGNVDLTEQYPSALDSIDLLDILGLENIESDVDNIIANYQIKSEKAQANGYAGLDENGKVPTLQLPSYVDDVLEFANLASFPIIGETGKIYVAIDTNKTYRWSGTVYIQITNGLIASTSDVTEGTNLYFTTTRVLATLLTGISFLTGGAIVSTDSILIAFGKLQKQINDILIDLGVIMTTKNYTLSVSQTSNIILVSFKEKVSITALEAITNVDTFSDFVVWKGNTALTPRTTIADINTDILALASPEVLAGYTVQFKINLIAGQSNASAILKTVKI